MIKELELNFARRLLSWFSKNKRDLPWRGINDPYRVWISEIILQQTRVEQGLPYYHKFIKEIPDVQSLNNYPEEKLLRLWQGLGYYSRALNLKKTAEIIVTQYNGNFPNTYEGLLKLKGVGPYTAAAIGSICFNLPNAVLDGNVYRFIARFFGIKTPIVTTKSRKEFTHVLDQLIVKDEPGNFNQGLMEMGALICTPKNPKCEACPFSNQCYAFANNKQAEFPVKLKKLNKVKRTLNFGIYVKANSVLIEKRDSSGIWKNLYQFPLLSENEAPIQLQDSPLLYKTKQELTHQSLELNFYLKDSNELREHEGKWVDLEQIENHALPIVLNRFVDQCLSKLIQTACLAIF